MTLGQFIDNAGLVQKKIAEIAGINESRLSLYCNGLIPNDEHRTTIAAALLQLTGRDAPMDDFWPAPEPEKA